VLDWWPTDSQQCNASQTLSTWGIAALLALKAVGYAIFRGSNSQKNQFRLDPAHPSVRQLQSLPTARGTRLLISGWWGIARHINYFGDWLMAYVLILTWVALSICLQPRCRD